MWFYRLVLRSQTTVSCMTDVQRDKREQLQGGQELQNNCLCLCLAVAGIARGCRKLRNLNLRGCALVPAFPHSQAWRCLCPSTNRQSARGFTLRSNLHFTFLYACTHKSPCASCLGGWPWYYGVSQVLKSSSWTLKTHARTQHIHGRTDPHSFTASKRQIEKVWKSERRRTDLNR